MVVIGLLFLLYILLSVPPIQDSIRSRAEKELTQFLGGNVKIGKVDIYPFNEVVLHNVSFYTPTGERCISSEKIAAGINLWQLIKEGRIVIGYAELIALNADIKQPAKVEPLNIQYIIDALAPKDKNKPPTKFDIVLHNVVIRKSNINFDKEWITANPDKRQLDFNHIGITNFRADIALPQLKNDDFKIDVHRIAFNEKSGFSLNSLSLKAHISPDEISVKDFKIKLPASNIQISDQIFKIAGYSDLKNVIAKADNHIIINAHPLVPGEFTSFYPPLSQFNSAIDADIALSGNLKHLKIEEISIKDISDDMHFAVKGEGYNIDNIAQATFDLESLNLHASNLFIDKLLGIIPGINEATATKIEQVGDLSLTAKGKVDTKTKRSSITAEITSSLGDIDLTSDFHWDIDKRLNIKVLATSDNIVLSSLLPQSKLGELSFQLDGDVNLALNSLINSEGIIKLAIPYIDFNGHRFEGINLHAEKQSESISGHITSQDILANMTIDAAATLAGENSNYTASGEIFSFKPSVVGLNLGNQDPAISGILNIDLAGNSPNNITGEVNINNLTYNTNYNHLNFSNIGISSKHSDNYREYRVDSDIIKGCISGDFLPTEMISSIKQILHNTLPSIIPETKSQLAASTNGYAKIDFTLLPDDNFYSLIKSPVKPGVEIGITGDYSDNENTLHLNIDAPYLVQGKNKLIKYSKIQLGLAEDTGINLHADTSFPIKNDYAGLHLDVHMQDNDASVGINWDMERQTWNSGNVGIEANIIKDPFSNNIGADISIIPSQFSLNHADWQVGKCNISYRDKKLDINRLNINHDNQYLTISGKASGDPLDRINVDLAGIDLQYIFNILNINYVAFGGIATGRAYASDIFSSSPIARTDGLFVKDLSYNNAVLGDAQMESHWDQSEKMVAINADIEDGDDSWAKVRGGVYVTRDSLGFQFDTHKTNIALLQPFLSGFTSSVTGRATGNIHLFGTFADVNLEGKAFADTITMKVDQTNVYYSASDTIYLDPGKIRLPHVRIYDRFGNSGLLTGEVTHSYLRDAKLHFQLEEAKNLLVYDTGAKDNPRWYGRVFGTGGMTLVGFPGVTSLDITMRTERNSKFNLILDETQTAEDYTFLTFSDRKREQRELAEEKEETFEDRYRRQIKTNEKRESDLFTLNLALDVTPQVEMNIVMDPKSGDNISGRGAGALRMQYESSSDNFDIYGKYVMSQGFYKFSLQELILKNFKIEDGSSISFNGDPLRGVLDIKAAYRVNTNLTDLDKSFASDPELNRTSVPVDAILNVKGDIQAPEIQFGLELPTVSSEVERKVQSIVSTEDMMNRQVIYLLALNRFYAPEYMTTESGGEFSSLASSTISSQISNIIGSMTDKFTLSPTFKSEKDDFSDMEVDVALSSSLFDNRLLLNGNLGYRDKSTSQTTFIGDFDLEYLLSKNGNLRLKAYNHFNDASYYLKSSLTTQGVGIIYRKDFNRPFTFITDKRRNEQRSESNRNGKKDVNKETTEKK